MEGRPRSARGHAAIIQALIAFGLLELGFLNCSGDLAGGGFRPEGSSTSVMLASREGPPLPTGPDPASTPSPTSTSSPSASPAPGSTPAPLAPLPAFVTGYNEGWFGGDFGTDLTSKFNPAFIAQTFAAIRQNGGWVVRIFLFELQQGLILDNTALRTQGIQQAMLDNIETLIGLARSAGLRIYFTALEGNQMRAQFFPFYHNILNNIDGEGDAFFANALKPVLQVLNRHQDAVYGLDLLNEIEAPISYGQWSDNWTGARAWMARYVSLVKSVSPWLRVTTTAGWGTAQYDIGSGLFSGIGLDFYDLHIYSDSGQYSGATAVCTRAATDGVPVILGEFGQKSHVVDDAKQAMATANFLATAKSLCFSGALAWRWDSTEPWLNYARPDGSVRPAALQIKSFSGL